MENKASRIEAAISGIGIVSPIGNDIESVKENLLKRKDGIATATKIDVRPFVSKLCAQYNFDYANELSENELSIYTDPCLRLAISTARRALHDSNIDITSNQERIALVFATCNGTLNSREHEYKVQKGIEKNFNKKTYMQAEFYSAAKALSCALDLRGQVWVVNTACSSSTAAIGLAESLIKDDSADVVIVGGADAVALSNYAGFSAIKVVSSEKTASFSEPVGMNIGEGSAFWIIENLEKCKNRKGKIYGKVLGHSTGADAYHPTQPDPRGEGAYRVLNKAIENANVKLSDIACINAHASGTLANDRAEAKGILKFLGEEKIPVTSSKSYIGHCMGATGILEATLQLISMNNDFISPTLRFVGPRKDCENLNVAESLIEKKYDCFLSSNYAFAGNNAAIVVAKESVESSQVIPEKKKIVITSHNTFTPLGKDSSELLSALKEGKSAIKKVERFNVANENFSYASLMPKLSARDLDRRIDFSGMSVIGTYATMVAKKTLEKANLKVSKENSEDVSLTLCVCRGADESVHLESVFASDEYKGNVASFSNITANSTAGWVSKALEIKGANITITSGLNSGLQGIMNACRIIDFDEAKFAMAVCADEVFAQELSGYANAEFLCDNNQAENFESNFDNKFQTVLGEGACAFLLEEEKNAIARGANILGTIVGYECRTFCDDFYSENLSGNTLLSVVKSVLEKANLSENDVDIIIWSPMGNAQDKKVLNIAEKFFSNAILLNSTYNLGYVETSSTAINLSACLEAIKNGEEFWEQKVGTKSDKNLNKKAENILVLASSHIGNNYALLINL